MYAVKPLPVSDTVTIRSDTGSALKPAFPELCLDISAFMSERYSKDTLMSRLYFLARSMNGMPEWDIYPSTDPDAFSKNSSVAESEQSICTGNVRTNIPMEFSVPGILPFSVIGNTAPEDPENLLKT